MTDKQLATLLFMHKDRLQIIHSNLKEDLPSDLVETRKNMMGHTYKHHPCLGELEDLISLLQFQIEVLKDEK